jgi:uncharacterized protein YdgA (DUF945 family)
LLVAKQELLVKKGIIVLLVALALIVLISPGLIGRMAEKSVDENLNWAAQESGGLVVTSEKFDRGWFSSQGQHRVEIKGDILKSMLGSMAGADDLGELPVLIIDTRLDHGLIPVSSLSRDKGSLAPGLGNAVSTLSIELPDGKSVDLPGSVFSKVSIGGALQSNYVLPAGSIEEDGGTVTWDESDIDITTNPGNGTVATAGRIGKLSVKDGQDHVELNGLSFTGSQVPTKYGFSTGHMHIELGSLSTTTNGVSAGGIKHMRLDGKTELKNGLLQGRTQLEIDSEAIPHYGEVSVVADVSLAGADAEAIGAIQTALEAQGPNPDPQQMMALVGDDLKRLLAAGVELRFDQLDVTLPMGTVKTKLDFKVQQDDAATFEWTSLLLATEASADISIPQELLDMAMQMNPQIGAAVGMGFLQQNGDVYEMQAEYAKGLLTINGAPMPIPLGMFQ